MTVKTMEGSEQVWGNFLYLSQFNIELQVATLGFLKTWRGRFRLSCKFGDVCA